MTNSPAPKPVFWRSFDMFAGLGAPALLALGQVVRRRTWPAGGVLFQRGDAGDWLALLESGRVKLTLLTEQGRELILRHAEAGDSLGEMALFDGAPRSADATAASPVAAWALERRDFQRLAEAHPDFAIAAARYFCLRLRETTDQLESIALYPLEARLARFFLLSLRQLNGADLPQSATLSLDFSQGELAAVLGASRPKVNRALHALIEAGALRRDGAAWLIDTQKLNAMAVD